MSICDIDIFLWIFAESILVLTLIGAITVKTKNNGLE